MPGSWVWPADLGFKIVREEHPSELGYCLGGGACPKRLA